MVKNANRRSIYIGSPVQELLRLMGDENVSQVINGAVSRYIDIVRHHRPDFSKAEWRALCDGIGDTVLDTNFMRYGGQSLVLEMSVAHKMEGLVKKWGIDDQALINKLCKLDTASAMAVAHVLDMFNAHRDLPPDEALAMAGVKP